MSTESLSCPFCGERKSDIDIDIDDKGDDWACYTVRCVCGGEGPTRGDSSTAIEAWNRRATPSLAMSTEDKKARAFEMWRKSVEWWDFNHDGRATNRKSSVHMAWEAWQEATRLALMSNAAPEVDRSAERVDAAPEFTHDPALCIKPACPANCSGCNHAISGQQARDYAIRYAWLRMPGSGVPISDEAVRNPEAYDAAIDAAIRALADPLQGKETPR